MNAILHITSGDCAGELLRKARLPGEVFVWHDLCYLDVRPAGWPDESALARRADFLERETGGGVTREHALRTLREQYARLETAAAAQERIVLWFDSCLFDQSMLAHLLVCLRALGLGAELICVASFAGIVPFHGLGQLSPQQLASLYGTQVAVTAEAFDFAAVAEAAFASGSAVLLRELAHRTAAPLPYVPAAADRLLLEIPDPETGCGRLEELALAAVAGGARTPAEVFRAAAAAERPPQYWGDTTLWARINGLAARGLLRICGPANRLPQWGVIPDGYQILPA